MYRQFIPRVTSLAVGIALFAGAPAAAQSDSVTVIPGTRYAPGSALHEALLGSEYRDLWSTPIRVPVLDLGTFAGGLTPVRTGGFQQTLSLRLEGADGREYNFRSVDKELTPAMPPFTRETFVDWVRQDQTSAQMPTAPVVASELLDATGVLNPGPELMVMPDDPRLGEFREMFAGVLGTLEVHPDEGENDEPLFAGAERVIGTPRLLEHLEEDLDHRVDSRAFLKARLMDVYLGDYDRHGGQWRWARYERDGLYWWVAIPEDRDYAFVSYDGLLLETARFAGIARLVDFDREYSDLLAMVDNSLALSRYLVSDLTWEEWEQVVAELMSSLTDQVLADAVARLPAAHFDLVGDQLLEELRARRERLPSMAREFYRLLSRVVEVHGTDEDDRLEIDRLDDGSLDVRLYANGESPPRYQRRLDPEVTSEVRVYLEGGDDEAVVRGRDGDIAVHVIGGGSDDTLIDESVGPTFFYDDRGDNTFVTGPRTHVDEEPWDEVPIVAEEEDDDGEQDEEDSDEPTDPQPPVEEAVEEEAEDLIPGLSRDWGQISTLFGMYVGWEPHAELVIGGGPRRTTYGYRFAPYESRLWARAIVAPLAWGRGGFEGRADFRRRHSSAHLQFRTTVSNLEATVFHGFGNQSAGGATSDFRIWREQARGALVLHLIDTNRYNFRVGPRVEWIDPEEVLPARMLAPVADLEPVTRIGGEAGARVDTRDSRVFPRTGFVAEADAAVYPAGASDRRGFGRIETAGSAFLPVPIGVIAGRAGARAAFGDFPFYEAVFIGGSESLRGHHFQRYAGDRAAFGGASLRVPLAPATILVHGTLGTSLFADAGRVWHNGESEGGWHTAIGASLWFQVPVGAVSISYARGEANRLYFRFGLPF